MTAATPPDRDRLEEAVWDVLGGIDCTDVARRIGIAAGDLAAAVERYREGGRAALGDPTVGWHQVNIQFTDHPSAARTFRAYLLPALREAPSGCWWFLRKYPHWRLRAYPIAGASTTDLAAHLERALDSAASWGVIKDWQTVIYEAETAAFGGPVGMALTHQFSHTDSLGVLDYLRSQDGSAKKQPDPKTTSLLAMTAMLRAAGLELGEQGDVWHKVEQHRPLADGVEREQVAAMAGPMRRLLLADTTPLVSQGGTLAESRPWFTALNRSGLALAGAASTGRLTCGIRAIAARRILFHWNRMGFHRDQQAIWASAAREASLDC